MTFQILSLSGGGYLGLYTATVLAALEERIKRPIVSCFDLVAGTSIGGIIALGLGAGRSAAEIKSVFETNGTRIFSGRPAPRHWWEKGRDFMRSLLSPKYDSANLRAVISDLVGADRLIGDLITPVLVTALNVSKGLPQAFKTAHHPTFQRDYLLRVVDVALATSAAPTYFPLAEIDDELFVDGGLYANSPDLMAIHEAEHFLKVPTDQIRLLSIGTTTTLYSFSRTKGTQLGSLQWGIGGRFARVMIAAQQASVDFVVRHKLGDRYIRIDEFQSPDQMRDLALDVAVESATKTIRGMAAASIRRIASDPLLTQILDTRAGKPTFYHPEKVV